jgi:hypothetical protein
MAKDGRDRAGLPMFGNEERAPFAELGHIYCRRGAAL